jgi:hypothetical protein
LRTRRNGTNLVGIVSVLRTRAHPSGLNDLCTPSVETEARGRQKLNEVRSISICLHIRRKYRNEILGVIVARGIISNTSSRPFRCPCVNSRSLKTTQPPLRDRSVLLFRAGQRMASTAKWGSAGIQRRVEVLTCAFSQPPRTRWS